MTKRKGRARTPESIAKYKATMAAKRALRTTSIPLDAIPERKARRTAPRVEGPTTLRLQLAVDLVRLLQVLLRS